MFSVTGTTVQILCQMGEINDERTREDWYLRDGEQLQPSANSIKRN